MTPDIPWSVIHCGPAAELKVAAALARHAIEAWVPQETVWRGHGPRRKPHDRPLIRGYVFARLGDRAHLLHDIDRGGKPVPGNPAAIAGFVESLKAAEAAGHFNHARPKKAFAMGDRVRVAAGPFAGVTGAIVRLSPDRRATVMLNAVKGISGVMTVAVEGLEGV